MKRRLCALTCLLGSSLGLCASARAEEPSTSECLAASSASLSYDNEHQLRAERSELLRCAARSCPADVRAECIRRVDEVNQAIPTILFEVEDAQGRDLSEVRVRMDEELLAERLEGIAIAIDPGVHVFRFEAEDRPPLEKRFVIRQGQKNRVELIRFEREGAAAEVNGASALERSGSRPSSDARTARSPRRKAAAIATTMVGVLGVGAGVAFGVMARSRRDLAQQACPDACSDRQGVQRWRAAKLAGNISTASFAAGGAILAGSILLWVTGRSESVAPSAQAAKGMASIAVSGRW